jgi:hypothetical protein
MKPSVGGAWSWHGSQALPSFVLRLFSRLDFDGILYRPQLRNPASAALVALLIKSVTFATAAFYRGALLAKRKKGDHGLEIALLMILMVILSDHNHVYYFLFVVISYAVALREIAMDVKETDRIPWVSISIVGTSYLFLGLIFPGSVYSAISSHFTSQPFVVVYQVLSVPVYGYLLLIGWLTWRYLRPPIRRISNSENGVAAVSLSPSWHPVEVSSGAHFGHRDHSDRSSVISEIGGS